MIANVRDNKPPDTKLWPIGQGCVQLYVTLIFNHEKIQYPVANYKRPCTTTYVSIQKRKPMA